MILHVYVSASICGVLVSDTYSIWVRFHFGIFGLHSYKPSDQFHKILLSIIIEEKRTLKPK